MPMLRFVLLLSIVFTVFSCSKGGSAAPPVTPLTISSFLLNGDEQPNEAKVQLATGDVASIEVKVSEGSGEAGYRWALSPQNIVLQDGGSVLTWKVLSPGEYKIAVQASNQTGGSDVKTLLVSARAGDFMNELWQSDIDQVRGTENYYKSKLVESDDASLLYELTGAGRANGMAGDTARTGETVAYQFTDNKLTRGVKIYERGYSNGDQEKIFDDYATEKAGLSVYGAPAETEEWTSNTYKILYNDSQAARAKAIERGFLKLIAAYTSTRSQITLTVEGQGKGDPVSFSRNYVPL
jgi:hypothetical protein